jgi:hypothetical protein
LERLIFHHSLGDYPIFPELVWKWSDTPEAISESAFSEAEELTGLKERKLNVLKFLV